MRQAKRHPGSGLSGALTLGQGVLASRLLGFARDALIASLLGASGLADAFLVAFRLPNFLRRLLAEGSLTYALVPACARLRAENGPGAVRVNAFARSMLVLTLLVFAALTLAGILLAKPLALALAPGLAARPQAWEAAALFLALCLPYLPLAAGAAVSSGLLLACRDFRAPAYAPVVLNLVMLAVIGLAFTLYGPGRTEVPYLLCAGIVTAGGAQWLAQVPALRRAGFVMSLRGSASRSARGLRPLDPAMEKQPGLLRDPEALAVLRTTPAAAFGAASGQINVLAATFIASFLAEGGISVLYFAERLLEFPLGLIGASLGLASLADLSKIAGSASISPPCYGVQAAAPPGGARGGVSLPQAGFDQTAFSACLGKALRLTLFCSLPAAVGLACLARPMVSLFFGHGAFDAHALNATTLALLAYCAGLPALAVARPCLAGLNALGDGKTPARAALTGLILTLALGAASLPLQTAWGPALAVSLAAWTNLALLARALVQKGLVRASSPIGANMPTEAAPSARTASFAKTVPSGWLLRAAGAAGLMAPPVMLLNAAIPSDFFVIVLGVPLGVVLYLGISLLLRIEETTLCLGILRVWLGKSQPPYGGRG